MQCSKGGMPKSPWTPKLSKIGQKMKESKVRRKKRKRSSGRREISVMLVIMGEY